MDILTSAADSVRARAPANDPPLDWRRAMQDAVREPRRLCQLLALPPEWESAAERAAESFPLFAPLGFIARMRRGDPRDPLLRQVLPLAEELAPAPGFTPDPVGEHAGEAAAAPGLLRKYSGRALLVTTGVCAVHCRYCFRRHFPYDDAPRSLAAWAPALEAIAADPSLHEAILSGGDPLTLGDDRLGDLVERLAAIPHLRRLRIHTRLPIMIPERVTAGLLDLLRGTRLAPWVVLHANHPAEFDAAVTAACERLTAAGIPLLNQSVLLAGVNDDADTLTALSEALLDRRIAPYYLHQLDRVAGAAHFEVPVERGRALLAELRRRLPGYAVPRYVAEIAGEEWKVPLE